MNRTVSVLLGSSGLFVGILVSRGFQADAFNTSCEWPRSTRIVAVPGDTTHAARANYAIDAWEFATGNDRTMSVSPESSETDFAVEAWDFGNISFDGATFQNDTPFRAPPCVNGRFVPGQQTAVFNRYYERFYFEAEVSNVYVHELGHALGLLHNDDLVACRPVAVMHRHTSVRLDPNCGVNGPQADDIAGISDVVGK